MTAKKKTSTLKVNHPSKSILAVADETKKPTGRRPIPPEQRKSEQIIFKVTPGELESIKKQAGDVSMALFIRRQLEKTGVLEVT